MLKILFHKGRGGGRGNLKMTLIENVSQSILVNVCKGAGGGGGSKATSKQV